MFLEEIPDALDLAAHAEHYRIEYNTADPTRRSLGTTPSRSTSTTPTPPSPPSPTFPNPRTRHLLDAGHGDAYSWVPSVFAGEGAADIYDENLQPKPSYYALQRNLILDTGAPHRDGTGAGRR